jgi:hypothetical protein
MAAAVVHAATKNGKKPAARQLAASRAATAPTRARLGARRVDSARYAQRRTRALEWAMHVVARALVALCDAFAFIFHKVRKRGTSG